MVAAVGRLKLVDVNEVAVSIKGVGPRFPFNLVPRSCPFNESIDGAGEIPSLLKERRFRD